MVMFNNTTVVASTQGPQPTKSVIEPVVFFVTFIIGTAGNILVIIVEAEKRRRTADDLFIVNLATSDLLFLFLYLPGIIYRITGGAPNSLLHCILLRPSVTAVFCSSVFTITSMAIYRSRVIRNPFKPRMKHRYAFVWIAVIWVLAFVVAFPAILVAKLGKNGWCWGSWPSENHKEAYIIGLLVVKCLLPLSIIVVAYIRIGLYVKDNRLPPASTGPSTITLKNRVARENIRIIKTLSVMVVLFAICTAPQQIAWMARTIFHDEKTALKIFSFSPSLNHFHSCVNPLIYGALTRHFRRGYMKYLAYIFCCFRTLACYRKALNEVSSATSERNNVNQPVSSAGSRSPSLVCEDNGKDYPVGKSAAMRCRAYRHIDQERADFMTLKCSSMNHAHSLKVNLYHKYKSKENLRSLSDVTYIETEESSYGNEASCSSWDKDPDLGIKTCVSEEDIILTVLNNYWQVERQGHHSSKAKTFIELSFDFSDIVRDSARNSPLFDRTAERKQDEKFTRNKVKSNHFVELGGENEGFDVQETIL